MSLTTRQRWIVLGGLLSATLAAAGWLSDDEGATNVVAPAVNTAARQMRQVAARQQTAQVNLEKLQSRSVGEAQRDPFAAPAPQPKKPKPPPPAPAAVVAPPPPPPAPAPSAPPLPFVYMGKLQNGSDTTVFLTQGDRNLVVKEGEVIDSVYQVERVTSTEITLVYLPLAQRQVLAVGEPR
jgi:hypothetical protein